MLSSNIHDLPHHMLSNGRLKRQTLKLLKAKTRYTTRAFLAASYVEAACARATQPSIRQAAAGSWAVCWHHYSPPQRVYQNNTHPMDPFLCIQTDDSDGVKWGAALFDFNNHLLLIKVYYLYLHKRSRFRAAFCGSTLKFSRVKLNSLGVVKFY